MSLLTSRRFLDDYGSDEQEYQTLINAGSALIATAGRDLNVQTTTSSATNQTFSNGSANTSGSIGISYGTDGFMINVSASGAKGKADGADTSYSNTQIKAGNKAGDSVTLKSGGDTTLQGAVIAANTVKADVGGNLTIESLQDTSIYNSKQQSMGGSLSIGFGAISGSVSASKSSSSNNYASVTEQSGIKAGDGGFDVSVKGHTDLKGAVIASTGQAIADNKNRLGTGTLTTSDLQNKSEASASSSGISLSSDMLSQGKYGAAKAVAGNALNTASASGSSSGQTRSAVSAGAVTITDEAAQQAKTGKTGQKTIASLKRDTATAQTAAVKQDAQAMQQTVEAERAIKQEAVKIVTTFTDETYRSRFQEKPKFFKVECPAGANCVADPSKLSRSPATPQEVAANASPDMVMAVNGIFNDEKRAVELAYQNAANVDKTDQNPGGNKPATIYLMHVKPAQNSISELMGVAYEKAINSMDYGAANFFGYTNAAETYAGALSSREDKATNSLGHSRGTLVQESSFTILANRPDESGKTSTNPNLSVRGVGGAADLQSYTEAAVKITGEKARDSITYSYFSNDPVSTSKFSGGNPGVWTLKDLWQVYDTSNSMHSCYGTGGNNCSQVETPVRNGPQGTPEGNARLIQFKGGQQVARDDNPITGAK
ncbi:hemagglutinin repeat-containing protein [Polaromonas sp.]|uniref:hemagglutinin repeat-containing protein n=1 Tax=Polaromonas sp. TaxID=1869339 RepID=UPI001827A0AC|nr:hemagglutinin repeat-containing protein [Polaromonas sp.]NMM07111.1 hypothetical protein [Polaromonas sp.]